MLRQIEWWVQNRHHKDWSFASNYFTFLKILFQVKNLLWSFDLIYQWLNCPICTLCKRWSFLWMCFFSVSILKQKHSSDAHIISQKSINFVKLAMVSAMWKDTVPWFEKVFSKTRWKSNTRISSCITKQVLSVSEL